MPLRSCSGLHGLLFLAALVGGCSGATADDGGEGATEASSTESAGAKDERPPSRGVSGGRDVERETLVVVEPLKVGPIKDEVVVSAKVEPYRWAFVFARLSDLPIEDVFIEEGDQVEAGDVLFTLRDTELRLAEQTAKVNLDTAVRTLDQRNLDLEEEAARIVRAERQAHKTAADLARLEGLVKDGLVNRQEVDDARLAAETAQDDLELARFARDGAEIALELAKIDVQRAEIEWERRKTDLTYATERAPISGIVYERGLQPGELARQAGVSTPAAIQIVDVSRPVLNLRVAQDALARLAAGQRVDVRAVTNPDARFQGVVRTVNPVLDQDVGTVRVIVDLEPGPGLAIGIFCEARIVTGSRAEALLVDKRAVVYEDEQPSFFVLGEDRSNVRAIPFIAGASSARFIEVVSDLDGQPLPHGLQAVVVGQESLKDGARVRVREEPY